MFGVGFSEFLLICFLLIILVNPKNAPSIIKYIRMLYRKLMLLKYEFEGYIDDNFDIKNQPLDTRNSNPSPDSNKKTINDRSDEYNSETHIVNEKMAKKVTKVEGKVVDVEIQGEYEDSHLQKNNKEE